VREKRENKTERRKERSCEKKTGGYRFHQTEREKDGSRLLLRQFKRTKTREPQLGSLQSRCFPALMGHNWSSEGKSPKEKTGHLLSHALRKRGCRRPKKKSSNLQKDLSLGRDLEKSGPPHPWKRAQIKSISLRKTIREKEGKEIAGKSERFPESIIGKKKRGTGHQRKKKEKGSP